jgi:hypothetical protein
MEKNNLFSIINDIFGVCVHRYYITFIYLLLLAIFMYILPCSIVAFSARSIDGNKLGENLQLKRERSAAQKKAVSISCSYSSRCINISKSMLVNVIRRIMYSFSIFHHFVAAAVVAAAAKLYGCLLPVAPLLSFNS